MQEEEDVGDHDDEEDMSWRRERLPEGTYDDGK